MVKVGEALVHLDVDEEEAPPTIRTETIVEEEEINVPRDKETPVGTTKHKLSKAVLTTPAVRRIARENHVDLSLVNGTGAGGRVLKEDVLATLSADEAANPAVNSISHPEVPMAAAGHLRTTESLEPTHIKISGVQRLMVKSMKASLAIPHFTYCENVEMDAVADLRTRFNAQSAHRLSFLPFVIKALSLALYEFPLLNSSLSPDEDSLLMHCEHNVGVAMDTPRGLVVPCLRRVQDKTLLQIAEELSALQSLGASGKLTEAHFSGTTITVSNIGNIGGTVLSPRITPPQVAIVGLGRIQNQVQLPGVEGSAGSAKAVKVMSASWAGDHRVLDGATMARFVSLWKSHLEDPLLMLAQLK